VAKERHSRLIKGGVKVGAGDIRSVVRGSVSSLYTVPENSLGLDDLTAEDDRLAAEAIDSLL
jgi:hypothetical protein